MELPGAVASKLTRLVKEIAKTRTERKALALILRGVASTFEADAGALFVFRRASRCLYKACGLGEFSWREETLRAFFHNEKPELPAELVMAPLRRGHRVIGVAALYRQDGFARGVGKLLTEALKVVGEVLGLRRRVEVSSSLDRLLRAASAGLRPKDLCYRLMHELRRFIDYDHGATLLLEEDGRARIVARQIAWQKGKSDIIGRLVALESEHLSEGTRLVTAKTPSKILSDVRERESPPKGASLVGCLKVRDRVIGWLEIGSRYADFFLDIDHGILETFLPIAIWCAMRWKGESDE